MTEAEKLADALAPVIARALHECPYQSQDEIADFVAQSVVAFQPRPESQTAPLPVYGEINRLKAVIERDRWAVATIWFGIKKAIAAREWLRLGRDSYCYDDDRWKDEFGAAISEIETACEPLRRIAGDLSDSPVKWEDVIAARVRPSA